jgi:hypothetical protein
MPQRNRPGRRNWDPLGVFRYSGWDSRGRLVWWGCPLCVAASSRILQGIVHVSIFSAQSLQTPVRLQVHEFLDRMEVMLGETDAMAGVWALRFRAGR